MRTTLTLDDDVAHRLEEVQRKTGESFKSLANKALRAGLQAIDRSAESSPQARYTMRTSSGGECRIDPVSISEALAHAEGESHK